MDVKAKGYDSLESLRAALTEGGLQAETATARNEGEGVKARMRVGMSS